MKSSKLKTGIIAVLVCLFVGIAILSVIFLQGSDLKLSSPLESGNAVLRSLSNTATATKSIGKQAIKKTDVDKLIPLGINNPFSYPEIDFSGENCLKTKSVLMASSQSGKSYSEAHINKRELKKCIPIATSYMNNIKDMGINVISQHFLRKYDNNGVSFFGVEEKGHINQEIAIQLYVGNFDNYFWAAINPLSEKGFVGDVDAETHQILAENKVSKKAIYLPASEKGFAEWQKWLQSMFDYLDDHNATNKLAYIQVGNESDGDYAKMDKVERDDKEGFYWYSYAKLIEKSYNIIKSRTLKTKIVIGSSGAGSVSFNGFQRPVLEYLAGKIDGDGSIINGSKKCGESGCFDVYDYHDFSGYKEYKGRTACQPRNCVDAVLTVEKTPENIKKMLGESGFADKKLVVQQGGTYTGQDSKINNTEEYQTEEDQASYLIKRGIYLLANGVEQAQFGTYIEHYCHNGTIHNWFTMMGFAYNGIPKKGEDACSKIDGKVKQKNESLSKKITKKNSRSFSPGDCDGQLPCPDPGKGVKKLSYFAQKKLIEILKDNDLNKVEQVSSATNDVYVFKTADNSGKISYFAWWDWWGKCPRLIVSKPEMDIACINKSKPIVSISVGNNIANVKVTEIIPSQETGNLISKLKYENIFNYSLVSTEGGNAMIKLGTKPIYIEVESQSSLVSLVSKEIPFGISNPYSQKDLDVKAKLPAVLKDLGLSKDENGVAGFIVDEIARKHTEDTATCSDTACSGYDFSEAKDLIDLVVGQGKANLWAVINAPSNYKFTDGKIRKDGKTYLPDGQISRQAYKGYLTEMVSFVNSYGKKVSGNSDWHVTQWNLSNEVSSEYKSTFNDDNFDIKIDKATTAYANFVIDTSEILRKLSPQSKIVLAGEGSVSNLSNEGGASLFYKPLFSKLKQANLSYEPFDYWESHWFGNLTDYAKNKAGYGAKDFIQFLKDNGYGDKKFVIRAGGTYSGQDTKERKGFMNNYQSEQDQAKFLVKRFIYNLGAGVKYIPWSTIYERDKYQGERHVHFQYISLIYDGYPDGVSKKQKCADAEIKGMLPCPDPGMGVKKLSYYSYKKLIEVLKGSDWNNIQTIQEKDGVYVYKFNKNGKPVWVAWNDNNEGKRITISGITSNQVKITEAIPKYESGKEVTNYGSSFSAEIKQVSGGMAEIVLLNNPVYIETDI